MIKFHFSNEIKTCHAYSQLLQTFEWAIWNNTFLRFTYWPNKKEVEALKVVMSRNAKNENEVEQRDEQRQLQIIPKGQLIKYM